MSRHKSTKKKAPHHVRSQSSETKEKILNVKTQGTNSLDSSLNQSTCREDNNLDESTITSKSIYIKDESSFLEQKNPLILEEMEKNGDFQSSPPSTEVNKKPSEYLEKLTEKEKNSEIFQSFVVEVYNFLSLSLYFIKNS